MSASSGHDENFLIYWRSQAKIQQIRESRSLSRVDIHVERDESGPLAPRNQFIGFATRDAWELRGTVILHWEFGGKRVKSKPELP